MDLQPERLVAGRYQLLSPLGEGGMGTVWRARDELLHREVAVKELVFPPGLSDTEREVLRERTRREARAAASLTHPSAVTVYDVVEDDGAPYLVLELVEARTLAQVVRDDGPLSPQRTAEVGLSLLGALEAAHARGILHRDVKPSNVLVREDGRVVLTDFGIATSTGDASLTHTGMLLGSPAFIAPERAQGLPSGPPSDLWSLGATLFTAVEGRPPFGGDGPLVVVTAVVTGEHAPYALAGPLEPALRGLLDKDPATRATAAGLRPLLQRAADASEAARTVAMTAPPAVPASRTAALDLDEVRAGLAAAPRSSRPTVTAPARSRRTAIAAAAVALLALTGGGLALASAGDDDPGGQVLADPSNSPTRQPSTAPSEAPAPSSPAPSAPAPSEPTAAAPAPSRAPSPEPTTADGLPPGWTTDTGDAGWTVALPPGYTDRGGGEYRGPGGRTLRVETGEGQPDAVADRERAERSFQRRHPTYERIAITAVDYRGAEAADWEFTYEGLHVLNRVFVVDGTGHSLFFQTREADFADARADLDAIVERFRPA